MELLRFLDSSLIFRLQLDYFSRFQFVDIEVWNTACPPPLREEEVALGFSKRFAGSEGFAAESTSAL
ncbi:hypothetical protein L1887_34437 [Cichorium endivia]|nr:hypothetical protein L1887_34437 [Cichorium endivia]